MNKTAAFLVIAVAFGIGNVRAADLPQTCVDAGMTSVKGCKAFLKAELEAQKASDREARESAQILKLEADLQKRREKAALRQVKAETPTH